MAYVSKTHGLNGYFWGGLFLVFLQYVTVLIRFYIRIFMVKKFGVDDWALIATLAVATAFEAQLAAVAVLSRQAPVGQFPLHYLKPSIDLIQGCELAYIIAAAFLKIAFGLLLVRVIRPRWMRLTIYATVSITTTYGIFFFFFLLFQCGDPRHFAVKILAQGRCLSERSILTTSYIHAITTALADITLALLSVIFVWTSDLAGRAKLSVGFILIIGSVGCVCTFVRIGWIHYLVRPKTEFFVVGQGIGIMSLAELAIGITCISLVTFKPLIQRYFPSTRSSYYRAAQHSTASTVAEGESSAPFSMSDRGFKGKQRSSVGSDTISPAWCEEQEDLELQVTTVIGKT